jgi:hypothetical protein
MPKNDDVFWLKRDYEVLSVATDGYLPPKRTIGLKSVRTLDIPIRHSLAAIAYCTM